MQWFSKNNTQFEDSNSNDFATSNNTEFQTPTVGVNALWDDPVYLWDDPVATWDAQDSANWYEPNPTPYATAN